MTPSLCTTSVEGAPFSCWTSVVIFHLTFLLSFCNRAFFLFCNSAWSECPTRGGTETEQTVMPTDLKSEAHLLERTITLPVTHAIIGDHETEHVTGQGNTSIIAGNAGPGLVAVPPR